VTSRTFRWLKQGLIFAPDGRFEWMQTHAQNPAVLPLDDRLRVYFNCRARKDASGNVKAYSTFVDLDRADPKRVIAVHDRPILQLGDPGTFDEFGVMSGTVLPVGDEVWVYYVGWSRTVGVPYNHAIGLATSQDDGVTFSRYGRGPIITRAPNEPFIQNSPFVTRIGNDFHMWYSTGLGWKLHAGAYESIYVLVHATSGDGVHWERDGVPCIRALVEDECQTNPCVIRIGDHYHMWFCYRYGADFRNAGRGYRIGYAWSGDLRVWHRQDSLGELPPSVGETWDSQMVCYPCVIEVNGTLHMFYSGNYFGQTGFGYALLDESGAHI
jgi:hypothetical protein